MNLLIDMPAVSNASWAFYDLLMHTLSSIRFEPKPPRQTNSVVTIECIQSVLLYSLRRGEKQCPQRKHGQQSLKAQGRFPRAQERVH